MVSGAGGLLAFTRKMLCDFEAILLEREEPFELEDYVSMQRILRVYRHQFDNYPKLESERSFVLVASAELNKRQVQIQTIGNQIFQSLAPEGLTAKKKRQLTHVAMVIGEIQELFHENKGPIPRETSGIYKFNLVERGLLAEPEVGIRETVLDDFPAAKNIFTRWVDKMLIYTY